MKKLLFLLALSISLSAFGMMDARSVVTSNLVQSLPTAPTVPTVPGVPTTPPASVQVQTNPGDLVAVGSFARPAVAVCINGTVGIAVEGAGLRSILHYEWTPKTKKWIGVEVMQSVRGGMVDAGRIYVPDIVMDPEGWAWITARAGPKEWGKMHGPVVYVRGPGESKGVAKFIGGNNDGLTVGAARLAFDPSIKDGPVLLTKNGAWGVINRSGAVVRRGTFPAGGTGEKFDFDTDGSTWATCVNGCSAQATCVSRGTVSGGKRWTAAAYQPYPEQGNDLCYPSVLAEKDKVYFTTAYEPGLVVQVFDGDKARYAVTNLPVLAKATMEDRCPPRLCRLGGRVTAVWASGGGIYRVDVEKALKGKAEPVLVASGTMPCTASDQAGNVHVVYVRGNELRYTVIRKQ